MYLQAKEHQGFLGERQKLEETRRIFPYRLQGEQSLQAYNKFVLSQKKKKKKPKVSHIFFFFKSFPYLMTSINPQNFKNFKQSKLKKTMANKILI